jgi:hypothetical protein
MKTTNIDSTTLLTIFKKRFARQYIGMDYVNKTFILREGVSFETAESMLLIIESLHNTCGFRDEEDEVTFYAIKEKFYRDLEVEKELAALVRFKDELKNRKRVGQVRQSWIDTIELLEKMIKEEK